VVSLQVVRRQSEHTSQTLLGHDRQQTQVLSDLDLTAIDKRIQENLCAADVHLTDKEFERIEAELAKIETQGNRTDEDIAKLLYLDRERHSSGVHRDSVQFRLRP
jgi:hypothetical protein